MTWKAFDYLSVCIAIIGGIALVALVVLTGWQVWGRYVLNDTPTWAERLSLLLILVVALPLSAVGLRENFHLGISMVVDKLPDALRHAVALFVTLLLGGFGLAMAVFGWQLVAGTWNRNIPLLGVPQAFQYLPLVVTGVLIVLFMGERLYFQLRGGVAHPAQETQ